jgi:hypothetical protein
MRPRAAMQYEDTTPITVCISETIDLDADTLKKKVACQ